MNRKVSFGVWFLPMLVLFCLGFAAGAMFDLSINNAIYNPSNLFGILMEAFGWFVAFLPTVFLMLLYAATPKSVTSHKMPYAVCPLEDGSSPRFFGRIKTCLASMPQRFAAWGALHWLCAVIGVLAIYFKAFGYLKKRGLANDVLNVVWLVLGVALFAAMTVFAFRISPKTCYKLKFWAFCASAFMILNQLLTTMLKLVWQRTRYDDMLASGNFEMFTPWYQPFGNGGNSFPSGHTANMAAIFALIILCDLFEHLQNKRKFMQVFCWLMIAAMALSRLIMGRHFLSDTLASAGIISLLFLILHKTKVYNTKLTQVLLKAENLPAEKERRKNGI